MNRATYSGGVDRRAASSACRRRDAGVSSRLSELEAALARPTASYQAQIISHPPQPSSAHKSNVIIGALIIFIRRVRARMRLQLRLAAFCSIVIICRSSSHHVTSSIYVYASAASSLPSYTCGGQHAKTVVAVRTTSLVDDGRLLYLVT